MKNTFSIIASAMLAVFLAGCNGASVTEETPENLVRTKVSVGGSPLTRATGVTSEQENNVANLQIFVFDESGSREYYVNAGGSMTCDIVTKEGKKTVMAVVNAPDMESIGSRNSLLTTTSLLSDNSLGSMVMTGEVDAVLQDGGKITIPVTRIISKVMIKKISTNFSSMAGAQALPLAHFVSRGRFRQTPS